MNILIIGFIELLALIKLKFTAWPEMLAWPYLNIYGWQYYKDIAVAHTPLMLSTLSGYYRIFGVGILQLKIFTWLIVLIFGALVYLFTSKFLGKKIAMLSLVLFFVWQIFFEGNGLWFDLFMAIFAFVSFYFVQKKKYLWAGIFWSLAFVSKQTAVWFAIPIGIAVIHDRRIANSVKNFTLGVFAVLLPFTICLLLSGTLSSFYEWAFKFGVVTLPNSVGQIELPDLKSLAIASFPFTVFIPWIFMRDKKSPGLILWALAGAAGAYPRFEYFHFQPAIPFLAMASAEVFAGAWHKRDLIKAFIPIYVIGSLYLLSGFFVRNWNEGTRFYEPNVKQVTEYVKYNSTPEDKIFVMNWWDSIYALSDRLPATDPLVPQLAWYQDLPGIQEKEVSDLSQNKPKLIILNEYSATGLGAYIPQEVYNYVETNYQLKETISGIDILMSK